MPHSSITLFAIATAMLLPWSAAAQYPQYVYKNSVHTSLTFSSEAAAHADILAAGGARAYLTKQAGITAMGSTQLNQLYVAPGPLDPIYTSEWVYTSYHTSGPYSSEAAIKADVEAAVATGYVCPLNHFEWSPSYSTTSTWGGLPIRQRLGYAYRYDHSIYQDGQWICVPNDDGPMSGSAYVQRDRNAGCPAYFTYLSNNKCYNQSQAWVYKRPLVCRATLTDPPNPVGNPCDVTNGDKSLRETDYSGPGLEIIREFHSKSGTVDAGFGINWTHNFHSYLIGTTWSSSVGVDGAISASGHADPMVEYATGKWVSYTGSGREVRKVGSEFVLHYPSGAKDYHSGFPYGTGGMGRLQRKVDPAGRTTTITRDASNRISSITGPFGHTVTFTYDANGNIEKLTDPAGAEIHYEYEAGSMNGAWRLIRVTYQDGTFRQYHYEDTNFPDYLTGVTDENGDRHTTYGYDSQGRAAHSERAGGYGAVSLSYAANNTTVTDGNGNVTIYNFRTQTGFLRDFTSVVHGGSTFSYTYPSGFADGQQRYSSVTNQNGVVRTFTYDINHKTSETFASGTPHARTTNFYYLDEASDRLTGVTTPSVKAGQLREVETTYTSELPTTIAILGYTPAGTAVSRSIGLTYNAYGQVTQIDGPRTDVSDVTDFDYYECTTGDECGQLESVTNALGHVTTFDLYDEHGRVLQITDANGLVTEYTYDDRGRTTSVTETPAGGTARVTTYLYDDAGLIESVEAPNGTLLTYDYDAAHNLISITDNFGNSIEYGYDFNGNRKSEDTRDSASNLKKAVDLTYDARNRIESINAAGSVTELVFDALGNLTDEADPNTNDTTHDYDALNRLVQTVDAISGVTEYGYDKNDKLTSVEAPNGATTTYVYDDLGNLLSLTSPDTGTTSYTYDDAGNRLSQTDANSVTVAYTYDALNRLRSIDYPGSTLDVTLTYDQGTAQNGRLTTMVDGSGTTTFEYDPVGNLTQESRTIDGNTHVTAYSYDAADLVTGITYPSGRTVSYTRNVLGHVATVDTSYGGSPSTVASSVTYEPFGPLKTLTFGNSLTLNRTFDQQYRLADQTTGSVQDLAFTLDAAGNIDAIVDGVNASLSQGFAQDPLHRVTTDAGSYGTKNYGYDSVGNRSTRVHGAATQTLTYTANSNRMATHDGQTISLDGAGNTLANPAENLSFTYGAHNRMLEAYVGAVLKATYVYDARGQRIKKVEATGGQRTIIYHYGVNGELLGETIYSSAGAKIGERDYLWLDTLPLAQSERVFSGGSITSSQFVYLHADQLNTPRLATNGSGTVVWRWDSDAFGIGAANEDPDSDTNLVNVRLRFPGQYFDAETGLHYNYYRHYDPQLGRYVQSDPIGLDGGLNTYLYANGNPLRFIDPFGLDSLVADHGALRHFNDAGEVVGYYRYTSGTEGVTDPSVPWKGPIPPGTYTFDPANISPTNFIRDHLPPDWGRFRVVLTPDPSTNTFGRDDFFLHGGDKPGSAGCIDIGAADRVLFPLLMQLKGPVTLRVVK